MARRNNFAGRLYRGEVSFDFVGRKKLWYSISGGILVISVLALAVFGLNFSIDFKGGSQFQFPAPSATATQIEQVVKNAGGGADANAQEVKPFNAPSFWQVQTEHLSPAGQTTVQNALNTAYHPPRGISGIAVTTVSASWGSSISQKALEALIAFLVVIVLYLTIAFEWRMAAAAFVALAHDIVITVGVYALLRFQVSPATVIGLLTILGYSLYDTVVVFDKVRENTAPILGTRQSNYSSAANLALNQTLVRSINTSLIALLPVTAILVVGTVLLGNGELKDLSLVLFVGMLSGTYSSICIATPVLADLKEREPQYKQLAAQVARKAAGGRGAARRAAKSQTAVAGATAGNGGTTNGGTTNGGTTNGGPPNGTGSAAGSGGATAVSLPDADGSQADSPEDAVADEPVPASQAASPGGQAARGATARPAGQRQQPARRPGSTNRRPSGKKKRR
jgi:preprotein translocase subunit SecF